MGVDPALIGAGLEQVDKTLGWVDKVIGYLKPYKPEAKFMRLNYRNADAEISLRIRIPDQRKRSIEKLEVPIYQGFQISEFLDETFAKVDVEWYQENGRWKLNPNQLPPSEYYLLRLKGQMSRSSLSRLVRIQPAKNRDQTEELDRYWLDTMIRDVELVEKIWFQLQIEEVNLQVRVAVERPFSTAIPSEMSNKLATTGDWIRVGFGGDRQAIFRQWQKLHSAARSTKVEANDILEAVLFMTKQETFLKYVSVDQPYNIGEATRDEEVVSLFPKFMTVEAFTDLSLKLPVARGYLAFQRKKFEDDIRNRFETL